MYGRDRKCYHAKEFRLYIVYLLARSLIVDAISEPPVCSFIKRGLYQVVSKMRLEMKKKKR